MPKLGKVVKCKEAAMSTGFYHVSVLHVGIRSNGRRCKWHEVGISWENGYGKLNLLSHEAVTTRNRLWRLILNKRGGQGRWKR